MSPLSRDVRSEALLDRAMAMLTRIHDWAHADVKRDIAPLLKEWELIQAERPKPPGPPAPPRPLGPREVA